MGLLIMEKKPSKDKREKALWGIMAKLQKINNMVMDTQDSINDEIEKIEKEQDKRAKKEKDE